MKHLLRKALAPFRGHNKGTVAVTFVIALPILLAIIGVIVQYALLANARITLQRAASAGARSAMTSLPTDPNIDPTDGKANVERAARIILESLSPAAQNVSSEAQTITDALQKLGAVLPPHFAERYTYAENAARITIEPLDDNGNVISGIVNYAHVAAPRARITVAYEFRLTVPGANALIGRSDVIAGLTGRYRTLTSTVDVQLSPGRSPPTDINGEPTLDLFGLQ